MNDDRRIIKTAAKLGEAVGVSRWTIQAIRKAGRMIGDPLANYSTPEDVRKWLRRHPDFVASHYLKTKSPPSPPLGQEPGAADKSGESSRRRGRHKPSLSQSEPQREQAA